MSDATREARLAARLREEFDQTFQQASAPANARPLELLAIAAGTDRWTIRLEHVRALLADRKIVTIPTSAPEVIGVLAHRGRILPAYALAAFFGGGSRDARWAVIVGDREPIALAFERFEGGFRARPDEIIAADQTSGVLVREVVRAGDQTRSIIDLPALFARISARAGQTGSGH